MLIEFSVSNFRSFRERQTLSMAAAPQLRKLRNVIDPKLPGDRLPKLLKVAAIYGPNASGKSSLVKAMDVPKLIIRSIFDEKHGLPVDPFRFDPELAEKPSEFEYNFIQNRTRYFFMLAATKERIIEETLFFYPKGKETLLYSRKYTEKGYEYTYGDNLEGGEIVHKAWSLMTGPQTLFIAQAVKNSSENLTQLKEPYDWFNNSILTIDQDTMRDWSIAARATAKKIPSVISDIQNFLQEIDVPITKIRFDDIPNKSPNDAEALKTESIFEHAKNFHTKLTHTTALGEAEFDFNEESGGTKNLMGFWLPWTMLSINETKSPGTLVVDEFDSSLHPKIVESLVNKHLDSELNSQLIFTTHDTHLMNTKILRRDQFWIAERNSNGSTELFSIHDFRGRDSEDVEKRYYEGRYRGLPILRRG